MIRLQVFGICIARGLDLDTAQTIATRAGERFGNEVRSAENDARIITWLTARLRTYEEDK